MRDQDIPNRLILDRLHHALDGVGRRYVIRWITLAANQRDALERQTDILARVPGFPRNHSPARVRKRAPAIRRKLGDALVPKRRALGKRYHQLTFVIILANIISRIDWVSCRKLVNKAHVIFDLLLPKLGQAEISHDQKPPCKQKKAPSHCGLAHNENQRLGGQYQHSRMFSRSARNIFISLPMRDLIFARPRSRFLLSLKSAHQSKYSSISVRSSQP